MMNVTFKAAVAALVLTVGFARSVATGPLEDALDAAERSDYATAIRLWRPLADKGEVEAQYNLGGMYDNGWGVRQNHVIAHMWFSLAAAMGDRDAARNRDIAAAKLTPAQIAEAQRLIREWEPDSTPR